MSDGKARECAEQPLKACPFCLSPAIRSDYPGKQYLVRCSNKECTLASVSYFHENWWNHRPSLDSAIEKAVAPVLDVIKKCEATLNNIDPFQASEGSNDIHCYCCGARCRDGMTRPEHGEDCDYWNAILAIRSLISKKEGDKSDDKPKNR